MIVTRSLFYSRHKGSCSGIAHTPRQSSMHVGSTCRATVWHHDQRSLRRVQVFCAADPNPSSESSSSSRAVYFSTPGAGLRSGKPSEVPQIKEFLTAVNQLLGFIVPLPRPADLVPISMLAYMGNVGSASSPLPDGGSARASSSTGTELETQASMSAPANPLQRISTSSEAALQQLNQMRLSTLLLMHRAHIASTPLRKSLSYQLTASQSLSERIWLALMWQAGAATIILMAAVHHSMHTLPPAALSSAQQARWLAALSIVSAYEAAAMGVVEATAATPLHFTVVEAQRRRFVDIALPLQALLLVSSLLHPNPKPVPKLMAWQRTLLSPSV